MNVKTIAASATLLLVAGFTQLATAAGNDCDARRAAIESQIRQAQNHNNSHEVAGLQEALNGLNARCTTGGLIADAESKVERLQVKQHDKQLEIGDVEAELRNAQATANVKKIAKYQRKLQEKREEASDIAARLHEAQAGLADLKA